MQTWPLPYCLPFVAANDSSGLVLTLLTQLYGSCENQGTDKDQLHLQTAAELELWQIGMWGKLYQFVVSLTHRPIQSFTGLRISIMISKTTNKAHLS